MFYTQQNVWLKTLIYSLVLQHNWIYAYADETVSNIYKLLFMDCGYFMKKSNCNILHSLTFYEECQKPVTSL